MDKHERPYKCMIGGCHHRQGFTSKGDLSRHQKCVHKLDATPLFCDEPGCGYGPDSGTGSAFVRNDHLRDHMRRKHGRSPAALSRVPKRVEPDVSSNPPDSDLELSQISTEGLSRSHKESEDEYLTGI